MKITEILTAINESSSLNWLDKIKLIEGYHNNGNLMKSNSETKIKQFNSLDEIRRINLENKKYAQLKFKTINLESSQIETYTKKYFECYGIDQPHGKFISNIKRFSKINESVDIAPFLDMIQRVDSKKKIKVHDKFSVLEFEIIFAYKEINCRGFITPKEVAVIKLHNDGTINYIKFTDGDRYPRLTPARYEGKPITYASYFTDSKDAQHALTAITLAVPDGWDLDVSGIKQSVGEAKRKSRKRRTKSKSVYSGWWGGYYSDNSLSSEGGGGGGGGE